MKVPISSCNVFIQVWVDVDAIVQRAAGAEGVYLVDNEVGAGSRNEGGPSLCTACSTGDDLCWTIQSIDPNADVSQLQFVEIGNCDAWGRTGQPQSTDSSNIAFTGQVQNPGTNSFNLSVNVNNVTVHLNPSLSVS